MTRQVNQRDLEGKLHGVWEYYYRDGTVWRCRFVHGKSIGLWENYYADGTSSWKDYYLSIK
jgi:antitoxin component YwqK of YwqJK toxin-antitoxin module